MKQSFKLRYVNQIVGLVVLLFLAGLLLFILFLLHQKDVFSKRNEYVLQIDQAQLAGLRRGMDVRILGESAGNITRVEYAGNSSSAILVGFRVRDFEKFAVLENSQISVARSFGVGEPYLDIQRGRDVLGVIVGTLSDEDAAKANATGVLVTKVLAEGPATNALQPGDVIAAINGQVVVGLRSYQELMGKIAIGKRVQLAVVRDGKQIDVPELYAAVVEHKKLAPGSTISNLQPEEDRIEKLQNSVQLIEKTFASGVNDSVVPSMDSLGKASNDLSETFGGLHDSIEGGIDGLNAATEGIVVGVDRLQESLSKHVDPAVDQLRDTSQQLSATIHELSPRTAHALETMNHAAAQLAETAKSARTSVDSLTPQTEGAIAELVKATQSLQVALDQTQPILDVIASEAQQLPGTAAQTAQVLANTNRVMQSTERLVDGVSEHWLLRRAVKRSDRKNGSGNQQRKKLFRGRP